MKTIKIKHLLIIVAVTFIMATFLFAAISYIRKHKSETTSGFNTEVPEPSGSSTDINSTPQVIDTVSTPRITADTAAQSVMRTLDDFKRELTKPDMPDCNYMPAARTTPAHTTPARTASTRTASTHTVPTHTVPDHNSTSDETENETNHIKRRRSFIGTSGKEHRSEIIEACIHEDQKIRSGDRVRLRITKDCILEGSEVKSGTIVTGIAAISGNRIMIDVRHIRTANGIVETDLTVMDSDNCQGIFYPELESEKAAKGTGGNLVRSVATTLGMGSAVAGRVIEGGSDYLSEKLENIPIRLYGNQKVTLIRK